MTGGPWTQSMKVVHGPGLKFTVTVTTPNIPKSENKIILNKIML